MMNIPQPGVAFSLLMWIIMIGVLVTVHEFGHYSVGRLFGVKALTFSIGFGRELFGWTDKLGTRWKISALPFGGYVKFLGDMDATSRPGALESIPADVRAQAFPSKPMWQRALIILAGPLINLLFAFLLFWGLLYVKGVPYAEPVLAEIAAGSAAANAGMRAGDRIIEVDGTKINDFDQINDLVLPNAGRAMLFVVERGGIQKRVQLTPGISREKDRFGNITEVGIFGAAPQFAARVETVVPKSPAQAAGLQSGDKILKFAAQPIATFPELMAYVSARPGQTVQITYLRDNQVRQTMVTFGSTATKGTAGEPITLGRLGVSGRQFELRQLSMLATIPEALDYGVRRIEMVLTGVGRMFTGQVSLNEVGGPLKIGEMAGQAASMGPDYFIGLMAMISISLGIMNLLPVPMLDGGHLALYAAEAVRGRPLNPKVLEVAFSAGFSLLIGFMVFLFWNDLRMFGVWRTIAGLWS